MYESTVMNFVGVKRASCLMLAYTVSCLSKLIKDVREDHPAHGQKKIVVLLDHITEEEITFRHTISVCFNTPGRFFLVLPS